VKAAPALQKKDGLPLLLERSLPIPGGTGVVVRENPRKVEFRRPSELSKRFDETYLKKKLLNRENLFILTVLEKAGWRSKKCCAFPGRNVKAGQDRAQGIVW